jgi:hypothetical protein
MVEKGGSCVGKKSAGGGDCGKRERRRGILIAPGTSMFEHFVGITSGIRQKGDETNGKKGCWREEP